MTAATPTLVLDFDGTLCPGDDPVRLYADEVVRLLDADSDSDSNSDSGADSGAGARLRGAIDDFLAGRQKIGGAEDGYRAIELLTAPSGLTRTQLGAAYLASRARLAAGEGRVHPPAGIAGLLDDLRAHGVRIVLITNAPATGVDTWLADVGIGARLDTVITHADKPIRMREHLLEVLDTSGARDRPRLLASVGDVWVNDIEPAIRIGARGFHIDRFDVRPGPATARAATFERLYPSIRSWARDPEGGR